MDKIDRENAADPTTAGVDPDTGRRNIDDDVTAEVVPGSEHGEPVIISNVPEGDDTPAHIAEQDDDALGKLQNIGPGRGELQGFGFGPAF